MLRHQSFAMLNSLICLLYMYIDLHVELESHFGMGIAKSLC